VAALIDQTTKKLHQKLVTEETAITKFHEFVSGDLKEKVNEFQDATGLRVTIGIVDPKETERVQKLRNKFKEQLKPKKRPNSKKQTKKKSSNLETIIATFKNSNKAMTVAEIVAETGIAKSSVSAIIASKHRSVFRKMGKQVRNGRTSILWNLK